MNDAVRQTRDHACGATGGNPVSAASDDETIPLIGAICSVSAARALPVFTQAVIPGLRRSGTIPCAGCKIIASQRGDAV